MRPNHRTTRACSALALLAASAAACEPRARAQPPAESQTAGAAAQADALAGLDGAARMRTLGCGACHAGLGGPPTTVVLAAGAGPRDPAALFAYLSDSLPARPRGDGARMPDFHLTDAEALALALYLGRGRAAGPARRAFEAARDARDNVDADDGGRLYDAFRCGACHAAPGGRPVADAPSLAAEGARVRDTWLRDFLRAPHAVRPFGARPGSGARMPDFGLSAEDVAAIATTLSGDGALATFEPSALSAFAAAKVETLLRERYDCLGCHAIDGDGGRIAPDLGLAAARLQPAYVRAMLDDPARLVPGTMMPTPRLTTAERDALTGLLATRPATDVGPSDVAPDGAAPVAMARRESVQNARTLQPRESGQSGESGQSDPSGQSGQTGQSGYLSPLAHATLPPAAGDDAGALYLRRCAACHGAGGRGDGFNAAYLPVAPTAHADGEVMADRPDDTLHDGIAAGARVLGKSARMPAFGASLAPAEIRALVAHIRTLCDCAAPAWSADGTR